jgi:2-aminoadipate transaminase
MERQLMTRSTGRNPAAAVNVRLAKRAAQIMGSPVDSSITLLQAYGKEVISFGMGSVGPDAIPGAALAELASQVLDDPSNSSFNYGPTEGEQSLRSELLTILHASGQPAEEETLLITTGGMQGLDLVCKLFLNPGDLVLTESPTYANALVSIATYEGRVVECPTDDQGIVVDAIPDLIDRAGQGPKLIYVIPNYQNPTGFCMSQQRRLRLLELARGYNAVILEDDPYGQLAYDGAEHESLFGLDGGAGTVVSVNTFSKVVAPGLRVGWVLAHPDITRRMVAARHGMDTCTNVVGQRLVASFLANHGLEPHILQLRERYGRKLAVLIQELERRFGAEPGVEWSRPTGGFFVWLKLPGIDADELLTVAMDEGVFFIPGSAFTTTTGFKDRLRLCFTYPSESQITEGVARLKTAYHRQLGLTPPS